MVEPKTRRTEASVAEFLDRIPDPTRREDSHTVARLLRKVTKAKPYMLGTSIVGFGNRPYVGSNGKVVDWPLVAFSPRKAALSLYGMSGLQRDATLAKKLGKHTTGKGCLYIKRLSDVDLSVLEKIVRASIALVKKA